MAELNETERALAVQMLRLAAGQFSNAGCNDWMVKNTPENRALERAVWAANPDVGRDETQDEEGSHIWLMDHAVMRYLAGRIEESGSPGVEFDWKHEGAVDICYVKGKRVGSIMFRRNAPPGENYLTALSGVACESLDGDSTLKLKRWVEEKATATNKVVSMTSPEAVDPSGTVIDEMDVTHLSLNSDGSMGVGGFARLKGVTEKVSMCFVWTDDHDYYVARDLEHLFLVVQEHGAGSFSPKSWRILNKDYTMSYDCEEDAQKDAKALRVSLDGDSEPTLCRVTAPVAMWAAYKGPGFLGTTDW